MNYTRYSLLTLAAAALLLLPLLLPQAASAQSLVAAPLAEAGTLGWDTDASAGGGDCVGGETVGNPNLTSFFRTLSGGLLLGQSFTAPCSGLLTSLAIVVYNSSANPASDPASGELLVFEGAGTGGAQLVAEPYTLSPPATPDTFEERTIEFLSDVEVVAGETYTYVMNQVEGGGELQPIGDNAATFGEGSLYFTQDGVVGNMVADEAFDLTFTASFAPSQQQEPSTFADGLATPLGVTQLDDGRVLVTEFGTGRVAAFNPSGSRLTNFAQDLPGPQGITQLADGRVLVVELLADRVTAFNADGSGRVTFADNLADPRDVTQLADGRVLIVELTGSVSQVTAFNPDGSGRTVFADLDGPIGVTQLADGRVLVTETAGRVTALNADGSGLATFADNIDSPRGATQLADGRVLVTENGGNRVTAFNADGSGRTVFSDNLVTPYDVTQLADSRVLVAEEFEGRVTAFPLAPPTASEGDVRPDAFVLGAAYPNPVARGGVTVPFALERAAEVRLALYDVLGRRVAVLADGPRAAGPHEATLATGPLPSGVYVVRLWVDGQVETRRVTVVR